jgi:hypothetical protein
MSLSPEFLRAQITEAKKRLAQLMREQQKINEESTDLRELIRANANLLPDGERETELVILEFLKFPGNITEAVRLAMFVTSAFSKKITPSEIKGLAESLGFDFSEYSNPMASVHTILKRMKEASLVNYDEKGDVYWFNEGSLTLVAGDVVSQQAWQSIYEDVVNTLLTSINADKGSLLEQIKEVAKMTLKKKAEAVTKRKNRG